MVNRLNTGGRLPNFALFWMQYGNLLVFLKRILQEFYKICYIGFYISNFDEKIVGVQINLLVFYKPWPEIDKRDIKTEIGIVEINWHVWVEALKQWIFRCILLNKRKNNDFVIGKAVIQIREGSLAKLCLLKLFLMLYNIIMTRKKNK